MRVYSRILELLLRLVVRWSGAPTHSPLPFQFSVLTFNLSASPSPLEPPHPLFITIANPALLLCVCTTPPDDELQQQL